jgi:membrane-associated phospholipid phosphatase
MTSRIRTAARPGGWRREYTLAVAGLFCFLLLTGLVQLRALAPLDHAVTYAKLTVENPVLEAIGAVTGILFSAEASVSYGALGALYLWRRGQGHWALAPLAFVAATPVEMLLKRFANQPYVPQDLHSTFSYPLTVVQLGGSFPSGHALRTGFFLTFLAVLLWQGGGRGRRAAAVGALLLALFIAYTRVYVGDHWLSDVVAGLALGAATALPLAAGLHGRLLARGS